MRALPSRWRSFGWWRLVLSDTFNRVCSKAQEESNGK